MIKRKRITIKKVKKIRIPLPKQSCKIQDTNKKVYNRKQMKKEIE